MEKIFYVEVWNYCGGPYESRPIKGFRSEERAKFVAAALTEIANKFHDTAERSLIERARELGYNGDLMEAEFDVVELEVE